MAAQPPEDEQTDEEDQEQEQPEEGQEEEQEEPGDGAEGSGTVGTAQSYGLRDRVMHIAPTTEGPDGETQTEPTSLSIAGEPLPGAYDVSVSGAGRKSQYLREVQANSQDAETMLQDKYGGDPTQLPEGDQQAQDGEETTESSAGGNKVPPKTAKIQAYVGSTTYEILDKLRRTPANRRTFSVELGNDSLDNCELVSVTRNLTAEQPDIYDVTITVREFRKYEVLAGGGPTDGGEGDDPYGIGDGDGGGTEEEPEPPGGYTVPVTEWVDENDDGAVDPPAGEELPEVELIEDLDVELGDNDVFQNKYVTDTDPSLVADGDQWAIRNVGFAEPIESAGSPSFLRVAGNGIIENVYIEGPGGAGASGAPDHSAGIYVMPKHWGDIVVRFCNIQGMGDEGVMGHAPDVIGENAGDGTTYITRCYGADNHGASFRLGKTDSRLKECISENEPHRSYWGYAGTTYVMHSKFSNQIVAGGDQSGQEDAEVVVADTMYSEAGGPGTVEGEPVESVSIQAEFVSAPEDASVPTAEDGGEDGDTTNGDGGDTA